MNRKQVDTRAFENRLTLKAGYHAGLVVGFPLAGVASDKLSRGACPNGAGRDQISRLVFYLNFIVDRFGSGMA